MKPLVYIILVNYNTYDDTIECVKSLEKITYDNYKVLIIDNKSQNDSVSKLRQNLKDYYIIESEKNLGFAGGNNIGIKYALENNADYMLLLNNDTVVETDFLDEMVETFNKNSDIGIVSCKINYYNEKERVCYGGGEIDWFKFGTSFNNYNILNEEIKDWNYQEITFASGCAMLVKKEVFDRIGLLKEGYFMYYEDTDFSASANEAGYKIMYNPKATIYHKISRTSGGEEAPFGLEWINRNRIIFMYKFKHRVSKISFIMSITFVYVTRYMKVFKYLIMNNKDNAKAIITGIRDGNKISSNLKQLESEGLF